MAHVFPIFDQSFALRTIGELQGAGLLRFFREILRAVSSSTVHLVTEIELERSLHLLYRPHGLPTLSIGSLRQRPEAIVVTAEL